MSAVTQSEFVSSEFDIEVEESDIDSLISRLDSVIDSFRDRIESDDTVEELLRHGDYRYVLKSDMSRDNQDPEPLTRQVIIEPLLKAIGYDELITEVSSGSVNRKKVGGRAVVWWLATEITDEVNPDDAFWDTTPGASDEKTDASKVDEYLYGRT